MLKSDGFYDFAWNPIEGCLNDCPYCYAEKDLKNNGQTFEPRFYPERLTEPFIKKPSRIFCTHYTDMMGDFIPKPWVEQVLQICRKLERHTFIFLTKNPARYKEFDFPVNCILGVTIESQNEWYRAKIMEKITARKMVSIEPMLGGFEGCDFSQFELVVVGALTGAKSKICSDWVNSVKHENIHYKRNVRQYLR